MPTNEEEKPGVKAKAEIVDDDSPSPMEPKTSTHSGYPESLPVIHITEPESGTDSDPGEPNTFIQRMARRSTVKDAVAMTDLQFVAINDYYERVLETAPKDEDSMKMCAELSNLLFRFRTVFTVQRRLMQKVREMTTEMDVKDTEKSGHADVVLELETKLKELNKECESLKESFELANMKRDEAIRQVEAARREMMEQFKSQEEKFAADLKAESSSTLKKEVAKLREEAIQCRDTLGHEIEDLKSKLHSKETENTSLHHQLKEAKTHSDKAHSELLLLKSEMQAESKRLGKSVKEGMEMKKDIRIKDDHIKFLEAEVSQLKSELELYRQKYATKDEEARKYKTEMHTLVSTLDKLKIDFSSQSLKLTDAVRERNELRTEVKRLDAQSRQAKLEISVLNKEKLVTEKNVSALEEFKSQAEIKLQVLRNEKNSLEKELGDAMKDNANLRKESERIRIENNHLGGTLVKFEGKIANLSSDIKALMEEKYFLGLELDKTVSQINEVRKHERTLEVEMGNLTNVASTLRVKLQEEKALARTLATRIAEEQKHVEKVKMLLQEQKELTKQKQESLYLKIQSLSDTTDELRTTKERIEGLNKYINNLKDGIKSQESRQSSLMQELNKLQIENGSLKQQLTKKTEAIKNGKVEIRKKAMQITLLEKKIPGMENVIERLKVEVKQLNEAKGTIHSILANKEHLINLYLQKMTLQDIVLRRGEQEYNDRVSDIKVLKGQLSTVTMKLTIVTNQMSTYQPLREQVVRVEQELISEKMRNKAMEVDMKRTDNVHRWRFLQGTDPDRYELIQKNQMLQKKLLMRGTELQKKIAELEGSRVTIKKLEDALERQPAKDVQEKMVHFKRLYQDGKDKYESLNAQVNMYHTYFNEYKREIEKLKEELTVYKGKVYEMEVKSRPKHKPTVVT